MQKNEHDTAETLHPSGAFFPITSVAFFLALLWGASIGLLGRNMGWIGIASVVVYDLPVALMIFLSAGGWGWVILHRLMPDGAPTGLRVCSYTGLGLCFLGTALFFAGILRASAMHGAIWWPVIIAGALLAGWSSRSWWVNISFPDRLHRTTTLMAALLIMASAVWVAGAALPAGFIGNRTGDAYDVVSYHLQIPREFYEAGRITFLQHNTYSNYPLGAHMIYLLSMVLRGGVCEGVYTAKLTHGLWGVLAAAALLFGMPRMPKLRRCAAALLMATMPGVIYVSWLAFAELSEVAFMATGLLWLHYWLQSEKRTWRPAALAGMMAGASCTTKYLSVGLVAGPLFLVMFAAKMIKRRRITDLAVAILAGGVLFAPWLTRNLINTGNPVFPLATDLFGRGHWTAEMAARWDLGHAPPPLEQILPIVRRTMVDMSLFGPLIASLALAGAFFVFLSKRSAQQRLEQLAMGVLIIQVVVWAFATHMPGRFLLPAAAPLSILAGGFFQRLAAESETSNNTRRRRNCAVLILALTVIVNLFAAVDLYYREPNTRSGLHGMSKQELRETPFAGWLHEQVEPEGRLLSVGDAKAFLMPRNTSYASVWEKGVLVNYVHKGLQPEDILLRIREDHKITHLFINWNEIHRLKNTYGWWEEIDRELVGELIAAGARDIPRPPELEISASADGETALQLLDIRAGW